jgi:hypothetical protein
VLQVSAAPRSCTVLTTSTQLPVTVCQNSNSGNYGLTINHKTFWRLTQTKKPKRENHLMSAKSVLAEAEAAWGVGEEEGDSELSGDSDASDNHMLSSTRSNTPPARASDRHDCEALLHKSLHVTGRRPTASNGSADSTARRVRRTHAPNVAKLFEAVLSCVMGLVGCDAGVDGREESCKIW